APLVYPAARAMSSRLAGVKPFSANTSSAASSRSARVRSRRRSLVHCSTMRSFCHGFYIPIGCADTEWYLRRDGRNPAMSELPSKKASTVTESLGGTATLGGDVASQVKPVKIWAAIGGALLLLQLYVWIRWITGPYFTRVPAGPSDPPTYMKVMLTANAVVMC